MAYIPAPSIIPTLETLKTYTPGLGVVPTKQDIKANAVAAAYEEKLSDLSQYSVAKIVIGEDADTLIINNDVKSTRIRGIDAMEVDHGDKWLSQPSNRRHVDQQKIVLAGILGKPVSLITDQDVFDYGKQQRDNVATALGGTPTSQLPILALVEQTMNADLSASEQKNLYGRTLGTVRPLIGPYTNNAGVEVLPSNQVWGSSHQYSKASPYDYDVMTTPGESKILAGYSDPNLTDTSMAYNEGRKGSISNLVDGLQYGVSRTAGGIVDAIVDAGIRLGKETAKSIKGITEDEANEILNSKLKNTMFANAIDVRGNFIGADILKKAETYGFDDSVVKNEMNNLAAAWNTGTVADKAAALLSVAWNAGPELVVSSAGEFLIGPLGKLGLVLNTANYSNQILEDVKGEVTNERRFVAMIGGTAMALINKAAVDEAFGNTQLVKSALGSVFKTESKTAAVAALRGLARIGVMAGGKATYEGLEEVVQESISKFISKYGTEAQHELTDGTLGTELFQAFGGGFGAGAAISVGKDILPGMPSLSRAQKDKEGVVPTFVETAVAANPNVPKGDIETAYKAMQEGTILHDGNVAVDEGSPTVTRDAYVAVLNATTGDETSTIANSGTVNPTTGAVETDAEIQNISSAFDAAYKEVVANITLAKTALTPANIGNFTENIHEYIFELQDIKDAMVVYAAKTGIPITEKIKAIDAKIERLIPVAKMNTVDELSGILQDTTLTVPSKIATILGSSNVTPVQVSEAIKLASEHNTSDAADKVDDLDMTLLYLQKTAMDAGNTGDRVKREKLLGGGSKASLASYVELVRKGSKDALKYINTFVGSQRAKLEAYNTAIAQWEADNNIDSSLSTDKKAELISKLPAEVKSNISIKYGTTTYNEKRDAKNAILSALDLRDTIAKEQNLLEQLLNLSNSKFASSPKTAEKRQKKTDGKVSHFPVAGPEITSEEIDLAEMEAAQPTITEYTKPNEQEAESTDNAMDGSDELVTKQKASSESTTEPVAAKVVSDDEVVAENGKEIVEAAKQADYEKLADEHAMEDVEETTTEVKQDLDAEVIVKEAADTTGIKKAAFSKTKKPTTYEYNTTAASINIANELRNPIGSADSVSLDTTEVGNPSKNDIISATKSLQTVAPIIAAKITRACNT